MEETRYVRKQENYSNDASSVLQEEGAGKHNRDLNTVHTSKWNVKSNYQDEGGHDGRIISGIKRQMAGTF